MESEPKRRHSVSWQTASRHCWLWVAMWACLSVRSRQQPAQVADMHVVTLRKPKDHVWACAARSCWTWKELVLGDGHDFFIPRPRATRRLASWLLSTATPAVPLNEVAILGNCKRFDLYFALAQPIDGHQLSTHVAEALGRQLAAERAERGGVTLWLWRALQGFDAAERVAWEAPEAQMEEVVQLSRSLELRSGGCRVARYACQVAVALEGRLRSAFNPCSAREAHIMLQLKRSLDAVTADADVLGEASPCGRRLQLVWRIALEAGKAVRAALDRGVARGGEAAAVAERLVEEKVTKCMAKLEGFRHGARVAHLRASASRLLESAMDNCAPEQRRHARRSLQRLLHEPSLALKRGLEANETQILEQVEQELLRIRSADGQGVYSPLRISSIQSNTYN
ncbi:unnamed protein product [Durusdinium trenchii]|uniref:Uncharacterized protein n=1 Tax=Durusdinium trenchii TaxID=1381693 RepID=A0ABP0QTU8_9DINO